MYSYRLDCNECPCCGSVFAEMDGTIYVDGMEATTDNDGTIMDEVSMEDGYTPFLMDNPDPTVKCRECKEDISQFVVTMRS
jgi:hypothetical protein